MSWLGGTTRADRANSRSPGRRAGFIPPSFAGGEVNPALPALAPWSSFASSIAIAAGITLPLLGCGGNKNPTTQPSSVAPPLVTSEESPVAAPAQISRPVKEGPAPLVYLVEANCVVRVMDMTDNVELFSMPVMARQIVAVNADVGIQVGGATMKPMRLSPEHRYGIYILSNQENVSRSVRVRPGGVPAPSPSTPGRLP